jgi:hypothetical protein
MFDAGGREKAHPNGLRFNYIFMEREALELARARGAKLNCRHV